MQALARSVQQHGVMRTGRALTYLYWEAMFITEHGREPVSDREQAEWRCCSLRTVEKDRRGWREVTGDAPIGPIARRVASEMAMAKIGDAERREAAHLMAPNLAGYLPS